MAALGEPDGQARAQPTLFITADGQPLVLFPVLFDGQQGVARLVRVQGLLGAFHEDLDLGAAQVEALGLGPVPLLQCVGPGCEARLGVGEGRSALQVSCADRLCDLVAGRRPVGGTGEQDGRGKQRGEHEES